MRRRRMHRRSRKEQSAGSQGRRVESKELRAKGQELSVPLHLLILVLVVATFVVGPLYAQTIAAPMESVTLEEAVERALKNNPTIAQASQGVLRAEALLQQTRAATLPNVNATFSNAVVDTERRFDDVVTQPRSQATLSANFAVPV